MLGELSNKSNSQVSVVSPCHSLLISLRLAETKKTWSMPFSIDACGTQRLVIQNDNRWQTVIMVKIVNMSAMQKKVSFDLSFSLFLLE